MLPSWGALYTQSLCRSVKSFFRAVGHADVRITYIGGRPGVPRKEEEEPMKRKIALFLALVMLAAVSVIALPAMAEGEEPSEADKEAAAKVAALIDAI